MTKPIDESVVETPRKSRFGAQLTLKGKVPVAGDKKPVEAQ